jgi:trk system potassium uptake protein TrkH
MTESGWSLRRAVRIRVLVRCLGQVGLVISGVVWVPGVVALLAGETVVGWRFLVVAALLAALGWAVSRSRSVDTIQANEAMVVVALAYIIAVTAGIWPLTGLGVPLVDVVFESVSAVTTTGLTTMESVEALPWSVQFARAWAQWYGGLGIAVVAVAMLSGDDMALSRLTRPSSGEPFLTTALVHARRVTGVYLAITVLGIAVLRLAGLSWAETVVHVLSAVSTGGFSTHDASLLGLPTTQARVVVSLLAVFGAVSLLLYLAALRGWGIAMLRDIEFRALLMACAAVTFVLLAANRPSAPDTVAPAAVDLLLVGLSAQTTSGFASLDVGALNDLSKAVLILSMLVGGSVGSTAGGFKLLRAVLVLKVLKEALRRPSLVPHAVLDLKVGGRRVNDEEVQRTLALAALFAVSVFLSWLPFLQAGYAPLDALFEVVSALGTVGLSTGVVDASLPVHLKTVLCFDMLLGRLEFIALLVVLTPGTWFGGLDR